MPKKEVTNIAGSVKARLLNYSQKNSLEFNSVLLQYLQERLLFRISKSVYSQNFILKGALLFLVHDISRLRPTKDIDLLGTFLTNEIDSIKEVFKEVCSIKYEDGIFIDPSSVSAENITEQDKYNGIRIFLIASLGKAKQKIQIDIGFGDITYPEPLEIDYPTLLDFEAPRLKVYSLETAIAEKFEAAVSLGIATSRMKDFFDIHFLASNHQFDLLTLHKAVNETFNNRQTSIEKRLSLFEDSFKKDKNLQLLWTSFLKKRSLKSEVQFSEVVEKIKLFLEPLFEDKQHKIWNSTEWIWI